MLGAALAWMFFNGNVVSTLGSNFTQVVFRLAVGPSLVVLGIVWACVIGLVGGLFPAIRAAPGAFTRPLTGREEVAMA